MKFLKANKTVLILLSLFSVGLFINTLWNDFTHDDMQVVQNSRFLTNGWKFTDIFNEGRVVRTLTLMLDHRLFGGNPTGYHLQNVIWHTLNTILLYLLMLKIAKDQRLAITISLLFASHPVHVEAVANISNRKDPLALFFMLSSILLYISSYNISGLRRFATLCLSFFTFVLALLSKQAAVTLPLIIIAYELYFIPKREKRLILSNMIYVSFFIVLFIIYGFYYLNPIARFANSSIPYPEVLLAFMSSISYYCQLLLWPINLSAEHTARIVITRFVLSFVILELLIWCIVKTRYSSRLFSFGLLWFILNLLPISNLIPLTANFFVAERYMYIPSVGFVIVLGMALQHVSLYKQRTAAILLSLVIALYSLNTINRNTIWGNDLILWTDTLKKYPNSGFAKIKIGDYYRSIGMPEKAVPYYIDVLRELPDDPETRKKLGLAFMKLGQYEDALAEFQSAKDEIKRVNEKLRNK